MKNKISILRIILLVLIALVVIFIIVFPIALRKILDERKLASIAKGYQFVEMINKQNILSTNKVDDGENIPIDKIKKSIEKIDGTITISEGKVIKADLIIDGYKFNYIASNDENIDNKKCEKEELLYYINKDNKLQKPNSSWNVYIKSITEYKKNYKESAHTLSYKYNNRKYSVDLDNEKECTNIMKKLSKTKGYSEISCKTKYKMILYYEQICSVFDDNILCFDYNSWNNSKLIKKQIEDVSNNDIKCSLNKEKLFCYNENDLKLSITKNGDLTISRSNDEKKVTCSLSKNKKAKCLNTKE